MTDATTNQLLSVEDLMQLDADKRFEVVDGVLVERKMAPSFRHVRVIDNWFRLLDPFVMQNKLGTVQTDGLEFILHIDEQGVRKSRIPDFSFIRAGKIPADMDWDKPFIGAPDLAIEVVSPNETHPELMRKVVDLLQYGAEQVWVVYPKRQQLQVHTLREPVLSYTDQLSGEPFFPGLTIDIGEICRVP